mmetsp:Transcript_40723/g.107694  ORF Transcript_40723/g.107694 Transcript_40723/m.107694 type:complete len:471 (+) Transcript_40723:85-1497(+)
MAAAGGGGSLAAFKAGPKLAPDADLGAAAKERGIEFFLVAFVDVKGVLRSKMVPAPAIGQIQKDGAGFAPFAAWLDFGPDASDMVAIPDPSTLIQLPFQPEIGFVIGDCYIDGKKVEDSPRWVLKGLTQKTAEEGYTFKTGVEPEFFLLADAAVPAISDPKDQQEKPCYDAQALMRRYAVLREIVQTLNACGFGVYQTDHEDANGQFEINWHYTDCLTTADQHVFFKWVTKTLAERHGFKATFMPRPFKNLTGNGCHVHCSLWKGSTNVFQGDASAKTEGPEALQRLGLSQMGLHFMGGVLSKATVLCALTNPTVNSYKRLVGIPTASGATWAPNRVSWSGNNRTHMIRVPDGDRFEVRVADGAANPYLLQAAVLSAGMWGLKQQVSPAPYFFDPTVNMYKIPDGAPELKGIPLLPQNLLDALRALEADPDARALLGAACVESFLKLKKDEWADFIRHLTDWELQNTLDC